jgi:hypothetical protein
MEIIDHEYPQTSLTPVYTDGSVTDAIKNGGGGVHIRQPVYPSLDGNCSNFTAEVKAITAAAHHLVNSWYLRKCTGNRYRLYL